MKTEIGNRLDHYTVKATMTDAMVLWFVGLWFHRSRRHRLRKSPLVG